MAIDTENHETTERAFSRVTQAMVARITIATMQHGSKTRNQHGAEIFHWHEGWSDERMRDDLDPTQRLSVKAVAQARQRAIGRTASEWRRTDEGRIAAAQEREEEAKARAAQTLPSMPNGQDDINALAERIGALAGRTNSLENKARDDGNTIEGLQRQCDAQAREIVTLRTRVENQTHTITQLVARMGETERGAHHVLGILKANSESQAELMQRFAAVTERYEAMVQSVSSTKQ